VARVELVAPAAPEHAHLLLVVSPRGPAHAAGDVVPLHPAAGVALLARFQRLDVVGGGEPAGAEVGMNVRTVTAMMSLMIRFG